VLRTLGKRAKQYDGTQVNASRLYFPRVVFNRFDYSIPSKHVLTSFTFCHHNKVE
jgi:hypothetical protein